MSPKTLTGAELQLDDGPARDSELFLVDGNNLAYRAFFALPEELQTTDGQPTNALLGFTNMLFKLLSDYRPRGVAVAWDTRPVHRKEIAAERKAVENDLAVVRGKLRWLAIGTVTATVMVSGIAVAAVVIKRRGARAGIRAGLETMLKLV